MLSLFLFSDLVLEFYAEIAQGRLQQLLIVLDAWRGLLTTEEVAVKIDKTDNLMNVRLRNSLTVDCLAKRFLQLWRKFKIFMLHSESNRQQVVKAEILGEIVIELGSLELLEEEDEDLR